MKGDVNDTFDAADRRGRDRHDRARARRTSDNGDNGREHLDRDRRHSPRSAGVRLRRETHAADLHHVAKWADGALDRPRWMPRRHPLRLRSGPQDLPRAAAACNSKCAAPSPAPKLSSPSTTGKPIAASRTVEQWNTICFGSMRNSHDNRYAHRSTTPAAPQDYYPERAPRRTPRANLAVERLPRSRHRRSRFAGYCGASSATA